MFCGCQCASRLSQTWSKSSCFSPGRTTVLAHRPLRRAFRRTAALPAGVLGPVDRKALRRLASICFRVAIIFGGTEPNSEFSDCVSYLSVLIWHAYLPFDLSIQDRKSTRLNS